jgi:Spy/CpxP family protein refolding chaperone
MSSRQFIWALIALGGITNAGAASDGKVAPTPSAAMPVPGPAGDHGYNPLHRQMVSIFALPEMQPELGLSTQQSITLHRFKQDLLAKSKDITGQIANRRRELDGLLSGDTSRTRAVKALFEKIADLHAQLQYAGFDTAEKMKAVLNNDQRAKFSSMKPADLRHVMMSRGNMTEIEETMQRMGAEDGMHGEAHDGSPDPRAAHHGG